MKTIPILNIHQFEQEPPLTDFYSNNLNKHLYENKNLVHKPHTHDFYLCVLFSQGTGIHEIDFNTYTVQPGSIFFLKPGQTHHWQFDTTVEGYVFFHTQDFYELDFSNKKLDHFPFYYSHKNPPTLTLQPKTLLDISKRFEEINTEYNGSFPYGKQKITSLLNLIYIDLARHYTAFEDPEKISSTTYITTLRALEKKIELNFKIEKSAQFYAKELNISSKHLNRITKTTLGKTTTDLITERVLLESKRLIVHSKNSLSAISEILGYEDYAYFSKVFKSKTKKTPLAFKKSYQ